MNGDDGTSASGGDAAAPPPSPAYGARSVHSRRFMQGPRNESGSNPLIMPPLTFHLDHGLAPPTPSRTGVTCSTRPISAVFRRNSMVSVQRHCPTCQRHRIDTRAKAHEAGYRPGLDQGQSFSVICIPCSGAVTIVQWGCQHA